MIANKKQCTIESQQRIQLHRPAGHALAQQWVWGSEMVFTYKKLGEVEPWIWEDQFRTIVRYLSFLKSQLGYVSLWTGLGI